MGIMYSLRRVCSDIIESSYRAGQMYGEKKKIHDKRRQEIIASVNLSGEQKDKIDLFYESNYHKKVPYDWHKLYQAFTGNFDEKYLPEYIFSSEIEPSWNPRQYRDALSDKNLLYIYTLGINGGRVKTPNIYISKVADLYRNNNMEPISYQEAIALVQNIGEAVIKPTVDSGSGKNVRFIDVKNGVDKFSGTLITDIMDMYKDDFNIQECVKSHSVLKALNPSSVNTFRIVTYIWNGMIYHLPIALRLGRNGNRLDNAHAGGMFVGVSDDGTLGEFAYTEFKESFSKHPDTGMIFKGYIIPQVPTVLEVACKMHARTPQLKIMSWDLTIDEQGCIVLIEVNTIGQTVWFPQMANGASAFGENTAEILQSLR